MIHHDTYRIIRTRTTPAQRRALKAVFRRGPIYREADREKVMLATLHGRDPGIRPLSYREWRLTVAPTFGMNNAVTVRWAGMWLAIEHDGYCHS